MAHEPAQTRDREEQVDEAIAAYLEAAEAGREPDREQFLKQHADIARELRAFFDDQDQFHRLLEPLGPALPSPSSGAGARSTQADAAAAAKTVPFTNAAKTPEDHPRQFGDYELLEEIARGGMGVVYKARQQSLGRIVAVKMILSARLASAADVQRFRSEAE